MHGGGGKAWLRRGKTGEGRNKGGEASGGHGSCGDGMCWVLFPLIAASPPRFSLQTYTSETDGASLLRHIAEQEAWPHKRRWGNGNRNPLALPKPLDSHPAPLVEYSIYLSSAALAEGW